MKQKLFTKPCACKATALALSALALSSAFVGCTDYCEFTESEISHAMKAEEFYNNFVKEFGEPDPNHTWGWGMTPEMADAILASDFTRAETTDPYAKGGIVNTNRNQWCTANDPYSQLNVYGVPGWPNDDGRYYAKEGAYTDGHYTIYEEGNQPNAVNMPNGDLTEYEILKVSNYVHMAGSALKNDNQTLHISEFYIQPVSCDNDYASEADYWDGNSKAYAKTYKDCMMDHLESKSLGGADTWTHINNNNWGINKQPIKRASNNSDRNIIYVQSAGTEDFRYHSSNSTSEWFQKFVLIEYTWEEPLNPDWSKIKIDGVVDTEKLKAALANPKMLDENTIQRTGYYLCFDYEDKKPGESIDYKGDDVYDNWILKVTPGIPVPKNRWPKRIMCEDLGNTFDFDFNDAVFDLSFAKNTDNSNYYDMLVVIQAAGGTMPIIVAVNPENWVGSSMEIHNLLGNKIVGDYTPVNVIKGGRKSPPATYRIKKAFEYDNSKIPTHEYTDGGGTTHQSPDYSQQTTLLSQMAAYAFKAKIYVKNGSWESVSGYDLQKGLRAEGDKGYNEGNKGVSSYPQLFNASADAKWTYENGHIKYAYKHFADWVQNEQCKYRLRWDATQFFQRADEYKKTHPEYTIDPELPLVLVDHTDEVKNAWLGSWDYGEKGAEAWGLSSEFIDKSKCWGGNGPE